MFGTTATVMCVFAINNYPAATCSLDQMFVVLPKHLMKASFDPCQTLSLTLFD